MREASLLLDKDNIASGKLTELIPKFYELKNVTENMSWHNRESVFDHTLAVLRDLERILGTLPDESTMKQALCEKIDTHTREALLRVATLFHDIAKPETIVTDDDGTTRCPGHERAGSEKVGAILKRFDLSDREIERIEQVIENHGLLHAMLPPSKPEFAQEYEEFKGRFLDNIYPELMLLAYADTIGSYQRETAPEEYRARVSFYEQEIRTSRTWADH